MKQERDNYNRLYEALALIEVLRNTHRGLSYDDIQEKFNWGRKTAERMLGVIQTQYGSSFKEERGEDNKKYFRLTAEDNFPPDYISENEVVALKTALGFVKTNETFKLPLENLAAKLEIVKNKFGSNIEDLTLVNGIASAPRPHIKMDREIVKKLQEAILACKVVEIEYLVQGKPSFFSICPLGLLYGNLNNYLIAAYKEDIDNPGRYKFSKISDVKVCDKYFDAKGFDIHKYSAKSFGVWVSKGEYKVKWQVLPEAVTRAKQFIFHSTQKFIDQPDGSMIVELTADGLKEMVWHLFTWEGKIKPLEPIELIEEYKNQLKLAADSLK